MKNKSTFILLSIMAILLCVTMLEYVTIRNQKNDISRIQTQMDALTIRLQNIQSQLVDKDKQIKAFENSAFYGKSKNSVPVHVNQNNAGLEDAEAYESGVEQRTQHDKRINK